MAAKPPRRTIARDSIFGKSSEPAAKPVQGIGAREEPATRQTGVWLTEVESRWLEDQCTRIRRSGWRTVTRSAVIRALIRAKLEEPLDLEGVSGEGELTDRLKAPR